MSMPAPASESLRLFFALWPDDTVRTALTALQAQIRGRLVPYHNLHLTLAFLGQQPAELLPDLKDILTHLAPADIAFQLDRIGYFTRNRIAWAGPHAVPEALLAMQRNLTEILQQREISCDQSSHFKPHVTLARDAELPADIAFTPIDWHVQQIALVQSTTQADGVVYRVLASRRLDQAYWAADVRSGNA